MTEKDNNKKSGGGLFDTGKDRHDSGLKEAAEKHKTVGTFFGESAEPAAKEAQEKSASQGYKDPEKLWNDSVTALYNITASLNKLQWRDNANQQGAKPVQQANHDTAFMGCISRDVHQLIDDGNRVIAGNNHIARPK